MKILKLFGWFFLGLLVLLVGLDLLDAYWNWIDSWSVQRAIWSAGVVIALAILYIGSVIKKE